MANPGAVKQKIKEDVWIKSTCNVCFSNCAIRVHRVDGVVVGIEGNPDCPNSRGGICAKGAAGLMLLYDPSRVNFPLKRTNPRKGIGVDPKWERITWDEALDTITEKLKKLKADDPRKLMGAYSVITSDHSRLSRAFVNAFGSPNTFPSGAGIHCGNGAHLFSGLMQCGWVKMPDPNYIKYFLNFGCPSGYGAYYAVTGMADRMADARKRGMKNVTIDPWMGTVASNADEWVPIRPGTDAALALAMVNLLLNDYGIYDITSLKRYTNGPYLVGVDGYFLRDRDSNKPMMWDSADGKAKTYDDTTIKDVALEGSFTINGISATTAFSLIKEHVKSYTPEMAEGITTVPAQTIRRLAKEFGEAAQIGSTIVLEGTEMPLRPVSVGFFRGASAHKHSALINMSLELLQEIVGANNVPGGCLGMNSRSLGYPATGEPSYSPSEGPDGMLKVGAWAIAHLPWPMHDAHKPQMPSMNDLIPTGGVSPLIPLGIVKTSEYKLPYRIEFILHTSGNYVMSIFDPEAWEKALKEDIFIASSAIYLDESTEFADIVLPDASYLERLDLIADWEGSISPVDTWAIHLRQPVIEPAFQRRQLQEVLLELAERLGVRGDMYLRINSIYHIKGPYALDPAKKYSWEEIVDRRLKSYFGAEQGLDYFKDKGLIGWKKKAEEVYWRPFVRARTPIYFEQFKKIGRQIEQITRESGIPEFDTADFQALPDWKPCASYGEKRSGFDLFGIYYRVPFHACTYTANNPWLDEASNVDKYTNNIAINTETAVKKGIKDGDWVMVESAGTGHRVEGRAVLTELIHPEVVAYTCQGGHWAKELPVASKKGKGVCPEWLTPLSLDYIDTVSLNLDLCVKVKVTKRV